MKPLGKVKIQWSPEFAYVIGLLVTDGNLSPDGRHIVMTSKDLEIIENFLRGLNIRIKIGRKASSTEKRKKYYIAQFGDVLFYKFLLDIGLMANKTKIIGSIRIPNKYFFDFVRGHFDGDGTCYSYWDKRWKSSFMFYTGFVSASKKHINWLREEIYKRLNIKGHMNKGGKKICYQLKYAKQETLKLIRKMYYDKHIMCLTRKRAKIEKIVLDNARVSKLVDEQG